MTDLQIPEAETGEFGFEEGLRREFLAAHDGLGVATKALNEADLAFKAALARRTAAAEALRIHGVDPSLLIHGISRVKPEDDPYEMVDYDHPNAF